MSMSSTSSPFQISEEAREVLMDNEAFRVITDHLSCDSGNTSFCAFHTDTSCHAEKATFRLHRDITHALLLPLLQIYEQASRVAATALSHRPSADLERAFRGEARSAYSWLQSLVKEEREWCVTQGCPACVVLYILHSEPLIRFVTVACRLSEYYEEAGLVQAEYGLPSFTFWLSALEKAVQDDPFWGQGFWEDIESRAINVEMGVRDLIYQSLALRETQATGQQRRAVSAYTQGTDHGGRSCQVGTIALKTSTLARRQLRMKWEEEERVSKIIMACWDPAQDLRGRRVRGGKRIRVRSSPVIGVIPATP